MAYQQARTSRGEICFSDLSKINFSSYSNGQHGGFDLPKKIEGTKNQKNDKKLQRIREILLSNGITITVEYLPSRIENSG